MKTRRLTTYCEFPGVLDINVTYIPVVSMLLYAQAAVGPEYEYPACLGEKEGKIVS
jgi:hypothetical protein